MNERGGRGKELYCFMRGGVVLIEWIEWRRGAATAREGGLCMGMIEDEVVCRFCVGAGRGVGARSSLDPNPP